MRAHDLPYRALNRIDGRAAIHNPDTLRLGGGERVISVVDLAMELHRLIVEAGFGVRFGGVAGARAGQAGFRVDVHQDGEVGLKAATGDAVERPDRIDAEAA